MPTYEYACRECGEHLEVVQRFTDDPLTECQACGGRLRKVFGNIGIAFKGSGFYKTDSRASENGGRSKEKDKEKDKESKDKEPAKAESTSSSSEAKKPDAPAKADKGSSTAAAS